MDQKFFFTPFALDGDQTAVPDAAQPSGVVSFDQGWPFDYQRELGVDPLAKPIERSDMNYLFYAITNSLGDLQKWSTPEFIVAADNGGTAFPYGVGAIVRYRANPGDPWISYVSKVATNTALPTVTTNWQPVVTLIPSQAVAEAGADNTTVMTPLRVKQAIAASTTTIPDATESVKGKAQLATTVQATALADDTTIMTPLKVGQAIPAATTTQVGRSRMATTAEATTGTAAGIAVTPAGLKTVADTKLAKTGDTASNLIVGVGNSANPFTVARVGGAAGVQMKFDTDQGAIYLGVSSANALAFGTSTNPNSNNLVWHAGNFTPASKADVAGETFTGALNVSAGGFGITAAIATGASLANHIRLNATNGFNLITGNVVQIICAGAVAAGFGPAGLAVTGIVTASGAAFTSTGAAVAVSPGSSGTVYLRPVGPSSTTGQMSVVANGNVSVAGSVTAAGGFTVSDERLKIIDGPNPYGLREILQIATVIGRWRPFFSDDESRHVWITTQQVAPIVPEVVKKNGVLVGEKVDVDNHVVEPGEWFDTADYLALVPVLIRAVQEQQETIDAYRDELRTQAMRLAALEAK